VPRTRARTKSVAPRTRTAFHEAGHAVLSAALSDVPAYVSIRPEGNTLGRSGARLSSWPAARVQVHLAGFAAEHLVTGRRPRQLDKELTFAIVARGDPKLRASFTGGGDFDGHRAMEGVLKLHASLTDDALRAELDRHYEGAKASLAVVWPAVRRVAAALLAHDELDRAGVEAAVGDADLRTAVLAVQRARGLLPPR
jgi:hypothetical protein